MTAVTTHRKDVFGDMHARSVVACGLDGETGEVFERRLTRITERSWNGLVVCRSPWQRWRPPSLHVGWPGARVAGLPAQRRRSLGHARASYTCAVFGSSCVKRIDSRHEHGENSAAHEINNQQWHFMQSDEGCLPHSL